MHDTCAPAPCTTVPDHCVCADDKLGSGVPLVVGYIVVRLEPDPLLTFGQEAVVTRLPFSILHHWTGERDTAGTLEAPKKVPKKEETRWIQVLTVFVTLGQRLQVVHVVIVVP